MTTYLQLARLGKEIKEAAEQYKASGYSRIIAACNLHQIYNDNTALLYNEIEAITWEVYSEEAAAPTAAQDPAPAEDEAAPAYTYYCKESRAGFWKPITAEEMTRTINAHFGEKAAEDWTGHMQPSRATAWEHIHTGQTLYTYTYNYKAIRNE